MIFKMESEQNIEKSAYVQKILVYTDTQNFWVLTRTRTVSLFLECFYAHPHPHYHPKNITKYEQEPQFWINFYIFLVILTD